MMIEMTKNYYMESDCLGLNIVSIHFLAVGHDIFFCICFLIWNKGETWVPTSKGLLWKWLKYTSSSRNDTWYTGDVWSDRRCIGPQQSSIELHFQEFKYLHQRVNSLNCKTWAKVRGNIEKGGNWKRGRDIDRVIRMTLLNTKTNKRDSGKTAREKLIQSQEEWRCIHTEVSRDL